MRADGKNVVLLLQIVLWGAFCALALLLHFSRIFIIRQRNISYMRIFVVISMRTHRTDRSRGLEGGRVRRHWHHHGAEEEKKGFTSRYREYKVPQNSKWHTWRQQWDRVRESDEHENKKTSARAQLNSAMGNFSSLGRKCFEIRVERGCLFGWIALHIGSPAFNWFLTRASSFIGN